MIGEKGKNGAGVFAKNNTSGVCRFYYAYIGSVGGGNFSYEIAKEDGGYVFTYEAMEQPENGKMRMPVGEDVLEKLNGIYLSCRLAEWNGFSKYNTMMLDGSGFSLRMSFNDGAYLGADGTNAFPKRYREFTEKMSEALDPLRDKVLEDAKKKKIEEGLHGGITSIIAIFKQNGNSGSDRYEIQISRRSIRDYNFKFEASGGLLPQGDISVYRTAPDEYLALDDIRALVEKHGIVKWYDFKEYDPDYLNREWFQISICFDDKKRLNATGSVYPENYEAFKRDLVLTVSDAAKKIIEDIPNEE